MSEITLRRIIEEAREAITKGRTSDVLDECSKPLIKLVALENRIVDALAFLEPPGENEFSAGLVHALRKILGGGGEEDSEKDT